MSSPLIASLLIASVTASGISAYAQQNAANKAAKINANNLRIQADQTEAAAVEESAKYRQKVRALVGAQEAAYASNNIDVNSGTAADIKAETAMIGEADANTILKNAKNKADSLRSGASATDAGQVSSLLAGGTSLLSAGATAYGISKQG